MISQLTGTLVGIGATWLVLDVGGVGFKAWCPPATAATLRVGQSAQLATSLVVREDSLTLYAFATAAERDSFELVQAASGIGPRIALSVVSVLPPDELRSAIVQGSVSVLTKVPGIGPKSAQRLVLELKDKVGGLAAGPGAGLPTLDWADQVASGLEGLGWSRKDAEAACLRIADLAGQVPQPPLGELMRAALRGLAR